MDRMCFEALLESLLTADAVPSSKAQGASAACINHIVGSRQHQQISETLALMIAPGSTPLPLPASPESLPPCF